MGRFVALRRKDDFRRTMKDGRRAAGMGLTVFVRRREADGAVRLGCIVRSTGAVGRNRIRRRVREALAAAEPQGGVDVVVRAEPEVERVEFQEMVGMVKRAVHGGSPGAD